MRVCRQVAEVWIFDFALESSSGRDLNYQEVEKFFDDVLELAESKNLQIGGGFEAYKENGTDTTSKQ